jgi:hypothetical protein
VWHRLDVSRLWELRVSYSGPAPLPSPKVAQWYVDIRKAPIGGTIETAVTKLVDLEARIEQIF